MKKLYFLLITLLITAISFGQDLIITGVFDGPLPGGLPKGIELYVVNNIADLSIYGVGSANNGGGTDGEEFTFPADAATAGSFIYVATEIPLFTAFFGFAPEYTDGSAPNINGDDAIELFMNGGVIDVFGDIDADGTGTAWDHLDGWAYRVNGTGPDGSTFVLANWTFSGINALDGEITNAGATTPIPIATFTTTPSTDPTLTLSDGPVNGDTLIADPETATPGIANIDFTTTNFTMSNETSPGSGVSDGSGDGFITWSVVNNTGSVFVDGGNIFTSNNTSIIYPVTGLVNGQTYFFTSELVANNGASLVPAVTYSFTFTIASYTVVPNLAALRASPIGDDLYYQVSGEVIGTYMQNNRNQKYIQDATAGILIDDPNFNIATVYNIGDGVENIKGQLSSFNGVLQFIPVEDAPEVPASSTGNIITPEVVAITELLSNWENYESELVEIKGATFVGATGNFATGTDYPINDGASDLNFRTNFFDANYIGLPIPTIPQDLVVLVAEFNGIPQVTARDLADVTLRIERDAINGFNLYPNPVTNGKLFINTLSNADKEIQIYNILGKQVLSTKLKGSELNVKKLSSGLYILKIHEDGKTATRKLVIK